MSLPTRPGRTQFVFLNRCGCPRAVVEGDPIRGAWQGYTAKERRQMERDGVTVIHIPHVAYVVEYMPKMSGSYTCPH